MTPHLEMTGIFEAERGVQVTTPVYIIRQGDQYAVPIVIKQGSTVITPDNCLGVRVALGAATAYYPGQLTYGDDAWYFPLTQAQSYQMQAGTAPFQVQVKFDGGDVVTSPCQTVSVQGTVLRGEW